jgi:ParB family chromosome partitioning protein
MSEDPVVRFSVPGSEPSPPAVKRKPPALGRGLGALLGESRREEPLASAGGGESAASAGGLAIVPVADIEPHPANPRRKFDEGALDELAASIRQRGVIQPVIVRPLGHGRFQLVAGERRWRAAQRAQLHEIPALVRDLGERDVAALALIENLQREDLNPIEEARAYQRLSEQEGMTQAEIARLVDKSRSHVANLQRLLALPEDVIDLVEQGDLSMGHARALIGIENAGGLAREAVARQLSVRDVERLARKVSRGTSAPRQARAGRDSPEDADIAAVQSHLEEFLGLSVRITTDPDPRSGSVTIRYRTLDQLDLICQRLTGGGV